MPLTDFGANGHDRSGGLVTHDDRGAAASGGAIVAVDVAAADAADLYIQKDTRSGKLGLVYIGDFKFEVLREMRAYIAEVYPIQAVLTRKARGCLHPIPLRVFGADGCWINQPLWDAAHINSGSVAVAPTSADTTENAWSLELLRHFGSLRILYLGDLTHDKEAQFVGSTDKLGKVDRYCRAATLHLFNSRDMRRRESLVLGGQLPPRKPDFVR